MRCPGPFFLCRSRRAVQLVGFGADGGANKTMSGVGEGTNFCAGSVRGRHKFGMPQFTDVSHKEFIRACRYCPAVIEGKTEQKNGKVEWVLKLIPSPLGLENESVKSETPIGVKDVDVNTGQVQP